MSTRTDGKAPADTTAHVAPKSFSPMVRAPGSTNAWDSLRNLTFGEAARTDGEGLVSVARSYFTARQIRSRHLPGAMFGEPAYDMLLALYVRSRAGARQTVSSISKYSGAPPTTALRWLDYLEHSEFVERRPSPTDKRVAFIELTEKGRAAIEAYLTDLVREGLTPSSMRGREA